MSDAWTIRKILDWTKGYLAEKGVENARLESEWMLASVAGYDRVGLYVNFDQPLTEAELAEYRGMVARRARREPLQHILGTQEFSGLEFVVTPAVLIPRHDTEVLVEESLKRSSGAGSLLDIGTGSGCIAIALAKSLPGTAITAVDVSLEAISVARLNADKNCVQIDLRHGSLFDPVVAERFNLIVSNPPYIPTSDMAILQPEVREFEPALALDGGSDGLDFYSLITSQAPEHLHAGGWLIVEVGIGQASEVKGLFESAGFTEIFTARDPQEIERVVGGKIE